MQQQLCVSPIELSRKSRLLPHSALRYFCVCDVPELLREGERGCAEGQGGRGQLRQVQVAAALLQVLRGLQILRSFT